ncbi:MAG TPA: helix-turn-helix transcriptional regulator [Thermoanaerobaculia bacterium]|nr:helix-turn-helix transcriptional regulator [Thermoanaerobaculia bacterium]
MSSEDDVQKVLALLKRAIRSSGLSQKEVDRKIGVQPGYLSQVMIGRLDLKAKHLLRALEAIQVDPAGFFNLAFPADRSRPHASGDTLPLAAAAPLRQATAAPEPDSPSDDDFRRLVARALAEELGLSMGSGDHLPQVK